MNKTITAVVIIIILAVGGWYIFGNKNTNSSYSGSSGSSNSSKSTNTTQNSQTSNQAVATNAVKIQNFAFSPADITVKKGAKVTWTNNDSVSHTVTENDGKNGPSAPQMAPGSSYSFTFDQTGSFHYHCSLHPEMTGSVTVTE
jgi:plastocyanin